MEPYKKYNMNDPRATHYVGLRTNSVNQARMVSIAAGIITGFIVYALQMIVVDITFKGIDIGELDAEGEG